MTLSEFEGLGEPINFWRYFWKISQIPRCSKREDLIRDYIIEEAKKFRMLLLRSWQTLLWMIVNVSYYNVTWTWCARKMKTWIMIFQKIH